MLLLAGDALIIMLSFYLAPLVPYGMDLSPTASPQA